MVRRTFALVGALLVPILAFGVHARRTAETSRRQEEKGARAMQFVHSMCASDPHTRDPHSGRTAMYLVTHLPRAQIEQALGQPESGCSCEYNNGPVTATLFFDSSEPPLLEQVIITSAGTQETITRKASSYRFEQL